MKQRLTFKDFFIITRSWSLTMTFVSVSLTTVYMRQSGPVSLTLFILTLLGAMGFHLGANCLNDYFDLLNKVDTIDSPGVVSRPHPVFAYNLKLAELFILGITLLSVSSVLGIAFIFWRSPWIGILLLIGLFLAVFYTARPIGLKYVSLGEIVMFLAFGPLMMEGVYAIQRQGLSWEILFLSLPLGILVSTVLLSNNIRDFESDRKSHIKTLSIILGYQNSIFLYICLTLSAFILVPLYIFYNLLPIKALLIFLSMPLCLKNIHSIRSDMPANIDALTANFVSIFGILLILSFIL